MSFPANHHVDQIFAQWDKPGSPGMSVAVSQAGKVVYCGAYGLADLDRNVPNSAATVFHAASLSKQFTAMAIMLLVGQGKLSLDDEVHGFIPQLSDAIPKITIRQMLHHTSGIRDQLTLATMAGWRLSDDTITQKDVIDIFVARMRMLNFNPGATFSYSNTPYTLASVIVKKVSGRSLAEFSETHIFKPLGMKDTTIIETHGQVVRNRAYGYEGTYPSFRVAMPNYDLSGPTNLQTTVEDLMRWEENFHLKKVGGAAALSAMQTTSKASPNYGLGLYIEDNDEIPIVEHDGRDAGYRSHLIRFPKQQLAVALLCNVALPDGATWALVRKVAAVYLGKEVTPRAGATRPHRPAPPKHVPLADYVGRYHSDEIGSTFVISQTGSKIVLTRWKCDPIELIAVGADTFHVSDFSVLLLDVKVKFLRDRHGQVEGFAMEDMGREALLTDFLFKKVQ